LSNTEAGMKVTLIGRGGSTPGGRASGRVICRIKSSADRPRLSFPRRGQNGAAHLRSRGSGARFSSIRVALARGFLDDPRWAWRAAAALGADAAYPPQYLRARPEHWPGAALTRYRPTPERR